ncbi:MAG: MBL fold metallo-hydrolase [Silicimonas sp.]|nr:MBL fold metallo-hydrolase [Silicimonas sp.]
MHKLATLSIFSLLIGTGSAVELFAAQPLNPADSISLEENHPNSFRNFSAELPKMRERTPPINTETGLHVSEIEQGLFFVTDFIYQSAFLVTDDGVVVFDAPPSFGERLRIAIADNAGDTPITHYIMSHNHTDHNGGGHFFADVAGLTVVTAATNAETLERTPHRGVLEPTKTFDKTLNLEVGGVPIELATANYHAEDSDTMIYLPEQSFLMAVDTITPGEAPFMNFGATSDLAGYLDTFETFLSYDFEHFLSGHVSVLGTRDDVIVARDYAFDVRDTVDRLMPDFMSHMMAGMEAVQFQHGNLAYRYGMEAIRDICAAEIIARWKDELSVVDLWADSHCETVVLYSIMH